MNTVVYKEAGVEVVLRGGRYFVRYDAGEIVCAWREDELTRQELKLIQSGKEYEGLLELQRRLERAGTDPYKQNWVPTNA